VREPKATNVRYVEVTNAQHFDAFLPFADYAAHFIPLHVYFIRAMNLMWDHLNAGGALPPSQVVRTTTRGAAANPLTSAMIPPILANPPATDRITFDGNTLVVPD
jgi:hydroxybutyrate-dimer hydrolase